MATWAMEELAGAGSGEPCAHLVEPRRYFADRRVEFFRKAERRQLAQSAIHDYYSCF